MPIRVDVVLRQVGDKVDRADDVAHFFDTESRAVASARTVPAEIEGEDREPRLVQGDGDVDDRVLALAEVMAQHHGRAPGGAVEEPPLEPDAVST
jgi:hypothetical protein